MAKTDPTLEWLAGVALFEHVDRRGLRAIHSSMRERTFRPGAVVVEEGSEEGRFYLITEGKATVTVKGKDVTILGPGDYFGEISLIDRGPRTATVTADTPLTTLTLAPFTFRPLLREHPDVALAILLEMCRRVRSRNSDIGF